MNLLVFQENESIVNLDETINATLDVSASLEDSI